MWGPKSICMGADFTWSGSHSFDASIDCSDIATTGDASVKGKLIVDSSADFSDVYVDGDITIKGKLVIDSSADFSDVFVEGDISIDGTTMIQNTVLTGDSTFTFDAIAGETGPTFNHLGDWSSRSQDTTYTARTDGWVSTYGNANGAFGGVIETPAGTTRVMDYNGHAGDRFNITCFVKKGNTWAVKLDATTNACTVWWLPFGDNT